MIRPFPPQPNRLYIQIAQQMRAQISGGTLKPGDRLPTLAAMHANYGASRPTVEKAYELLEREGLIERVHGIGATVATARKLRAGVIGLCGRGFFGGGSTFYWSQLLAGINDGARAASSQILLLDRELRAGWGKVDGILLSGWAEPDFLPYIPAQMPLVSLMAPIPNKASVRADEYAGARAATSHLLDLGHRDIAFLHGPAADMTARIRGHEDALRAAKIRPRKAWCRTTSISEVQGVPYLQVGRDDMARWLADTSAKGWNRIGCTALLCQNDAVAVGAMQALHAANFQVPRDVSVVGFDGTDLGEMVSPTLSSVALPLREIGSAAIELLLRQIQDDTVSAQQHIFPTELQVRESTAAPRPA